MSAPLVNPAGPSALPGLFHMERCRMSRSIERSARLSDSTTGSELCLS